MNNGSSRRVKSVRFTQENQVLVFETPTAMDNDFGASNWTTATKPGSVRERVKQYNQSVQPRPPALPPKNAVQVPVARATQKPSPPKPPPRSINTYSTVCRPKVRIFRRDPGARPVTEGRARRGEAATLLGKEVTPVDLHYRIKVPDTPPPPPPLPPTSPATLVPSAPPASSVSSVDNDDGIQRDPTQEQTDGRDNDDDDDRNEKSGCAAGCLLFIVGCIGCIIG